MFSTLRAARSFALTSALCLAAPSLIAQALNTADRPSELTVFAAGAFASPHYGPDYNVGVSAGVEFTRYFHFPVAPSFLVRADYTSGTQQNERDLLFGFSGRVRIRNEHIRPYISGLAGIGRINFTPPFDPLYTQDTGLVYSGGAGVEIDVIRNFRLRADYQIQRWDFGPDGPNSTFVIHPRIATIGVTYQIPFRPYMRHGDELRSDR